MSAPPYFKIFIMASKEEITQSPVQTENEQFYKTSFVKNFKTLYLTKPIEEILNDFANCYLECSSLEQKLNSYLEK